MPKDSKAPAPAVQSSQPAADIAVQPATTSEAVNPAAANNAEQPAEVFTHTVKAGPAKGFHRAGKLWTREETKVNRVAFTDEQWEAIEAEPMLTVQPL